MCDGYAGHRKRAKAIELRHPGWKRGLGGHLQWALETFMSDSTSLTRLKGEQRSYSRGSPIPDDPNRNLFSQVVNIGLVAGEVLRLPEPVDGFRQALRLGELRGPIGQ